jgi:hypothetical protein
MDGAILGMAAALAAKKSMMLHETSHCRVGRQWTEFGLPS